MSVDYRVGDSRELVRSLPDSSVDFVTCSPPFLALRDYGTGSPAEIGREGSPAEFLAVLLDLAVECRRVLTPHGSLAWELGDSFSGSGGAGGDYNEGGMRDGQNAFSGTASRLRKRTDGKGWPLAKSLCGIPTLFAWSLAYGRNLLAEPLTATELLDVIDRHVADGFTAEHAIAAARTMTGRHDRFVRRFEPWRVRNVIVWARNNPAVGALGDKVRPATSYITVACPSVSRWFDLDAVRGPGSPNTNARVAKGTGSRPASGKRCEQPDGNRQAMPMVETSGAPPLDHWNDEYDGDLTWLVNTAGSSLAHYAMWPAKLAERLVLSMCPAEVCRQCGEPRRRIVEASYERDDRGGTTGARRDADNPNGHGKGSQGKVALARLTETLGWSDCGHGDYRRGVTLDPFAGTFTTGWVAEFHGRDAIGFDLDARNRDDLAPKRRREVFRNLGLNVPKLDDAQPDLFSAFEVPT